MAIAELGATGRAAPGYLGPSSTYTFTTPAAVTATTHVMVVYLYWEALTAPTPPNGFIQAAPAINDSGNLYSFAPFVGRHTGAGTYAFGLGSSVNAEGFMLGFSGVSGGPLIDAVGGQRNASSTNATFTNITTSQANSMLVGLIGAIGSPTFTPASGFTEAHDADGFETSFKATTTPGAVGTLNATMATGFETITFIVALPEQGTGRDDRRRSHRRKALQAVGRSVNW